MSWEEIDEKIIALNDKIERFSYKKQQISELANIIKDRQQKLENNKDIRKLNNAVLENKVKVSTFQTILLTKLNELSLSNDMNEVYQNIPDTLEECNNFLNQLERKYQLGEKIIDWVEGIERLSETEYIENLSFEETEYGKWIMFKDDRLEELIHQVFNSQMSTNKEFLSILVNNAIDRIKKYLNDLTLEQKTELFIQTIALSYNKNSFLFFHKYMFINCIYQSNPSKPSSSKIEIIYDHFHNLVERKLLLQCKNQSVVELLGNVNIDFNNIIIREEEKKKKV